MIIVSNISTYFLHDSAQLPSINLVDPGLDKIGWGTEFFTEALALWSLSMNSPRFSENNSQSNYEFKRTPIITRFTEEDDCKSLKYFSWYCIGQKYNK